MESSQYFYKKLISHKIPLRYLLRDERLFSKVPKFWYVIVADIENSTETIQNGKHKDVNLAATGSIIVVLNHIKVNDPKLKIPYFFGGDGVTMLLPNYKIDEIMSILENYSLHIKKTLQLKLRVGFMKVSDIQKANHQIKIAKLRLNEYLTVPIVLGLGLKYAEKKIKETFTENEKPINDYDINLEGMECRWDEIAPQREAEKVVCLLVYCSDESKQAVVFEKVMNEITKAFGDLKRRQPITSTRLILNHTIEKIRKEMYARIGKYNPFYLLKNWLVTLMGKYYFKYFKDGQQYLKEVVELSDTLMVDGSINTVISGSTEQVNRLIKSLDQLELKGEITYGIHITYASIISCYVQDRKNYHVHFVDGTEGGYTSAAIVYKEKMKRRNDIA